MAAESQGCRCRCGRNGAVQRLFAWCYARSEAHELDRIFETRKRRLLSDLSGDVLEIGPGTGVNFRYFPPGIRWTGIEPNLFMHSHLQKQAAKFALASADIHDAAVEHLNLPDSSMDAVVSTHVLCSVDDQTRALEEVLRVLRPGGRFVFVEHVAAPYGSWLRRAQRFVKPVWSLLGDGCHPDRQTWDSIANAGFASVTIEHFHVPMPIASPHIAGFAVKHGVRQP